MSRPNSHFARGSHTVHAARSRRQSPVPVDDDWPFGPGVKDHPFFADDDEPVCTLGPFDEITGWVVVLTSAAFLAPALSAWNAGMAYKALVFVALACWSSFYHIMDACLWPPSDAGWTLYDFAQDMDFFLSYYVFVMMALTALGPEDELGVPCDNTKWLWVQRVSTFALSGVLMGRHAGAKFDTAFNVSCLTVNVLLWCSFYYVSFSTKLFGYASRHRLAGEAVAASAALFIYGYAAEELGPYWMWHSLWHILDAALCWSILRNRMVANCSGAQG